MSRQTIKAAINAYIKRNGVQAITGQVLNAVLNAMNDGHTTTVNIDITGTTGAYQFSVDGAVLNFKDLSDLLRVSQDLLVFSHNGMIFSRSAKDLDGNPKIFVLFNSMLSGDVAIHRFFIVTSTDGETIANVELVEEKVTASKEYVDTELAKKVNQTNFATFKSNVEASLEELGGDVSELEQTKADKSELEAESEDRQRVEGEIKEQIAGIVASSDVVDIVGTYEELENYDTSKLGDNDIIKVLQDSTHDDASSFYRYKASSDSFEYIGSEAKGYTQAEADAKFVNQMEYEIDLDGKQDKLTEAQLANIAAVPNKADKTDVQTLQAEVNRIFADFAEYDKTDFPDVNFGTPTRSGAYIGANGQFVTDSNYNVSNDIEVVRGNLYKLYVGKETTIPNGIAVFSKKVVSLTPSGEKVSYVPQFVSAGGATPKSGYLVFLATEDMTIVTSYPTSATKLEVVRYGVLASLCTQIDGLRKAVDLKSFADGYYAQMRVGLADNLTPRGESVDAEFTERIAGGGMSITDGSSKYEEVRGNSVVWNQLVDADDFSYRVTSQTSTYSQRIGLTKKTVSIIEGHIYLISAMVDRSIAVNDQVNICLFAATTATNGSAYFVAYNGTPNGYMARVFTATASLSGNAVFINNYGGKRGYDEGDSVAFSNLRLIDLTRMFGAGNEPSTPDEFLRRKPEVADEYAYNEGEIVNNKVEGIKTTDADGNEIGRLDLSWIKDIKDEGGVALFEDGLRSAGSVFDVVADRKATKRIGVVDLGSLDWDKDAQQRMQTTSLQDIIHKVPVSTDIMKGILIGYTPYSSSGTYNHTIDNSMGTKSNGMFVVYSSAWADKTPAEFKTAMQGQYLYFELAEPIEVEYSEKNMTIPVVSGGMEIAVADVPSSPLKAKIVYGMDAYNQIVANKDNVGSLASLATTDKSSLVAAINELAARIASLQSSTNITE